VPEEDRVCELVLVDPAGRARVADDEVELERGEAAAADRMGVRGKGGRAGEIVADLDARARAATRARLPVEAVAVRVAADGRRAPADIPAAAGRQFQRDRVRGERSDVTGAVNVLADLVQRQPCCELGLEAPVLLGL